MDIRGSLVNYSYKFGAPIAAERPEHPCGQPNLSSQHSVAVKILRLFQSIRKSEKKNHPQKIQCHFEN